MKFKFHSTEITVSYLLICLAALGVIVASFQSFAICLFSVAVHESGHILIMCLFGSPPDKIKISPFEISIMDNARQSRKFFQNILIIIFGPFSNLICFILFYLLYLLCNENFFSLAAANLSVGLFNLIPVMSLDGGQLLYLLLCRRLDEALAQKLVNFATFLFIFPLAAAGFLLLLKSKYNFSLLFVSVYLVLSLALKNNRYY